MNPLPWLLSVVMPACRSEGVRGLPVPPPMDVAAIVRPASPNTALAGPDGHSPAPDRVIAPYPIPPDVLYRAVRAVARDQDRTFPAAHYDELRQAHYVVRSKWANFPDLVTIAVAGPETGPSTLVVYSRSVYGHSDLGVNRARIEVWLAALSTAFER